MERIEAYRGFEIWRTSEGRLVVVDPADSVEERAELVQQPADADALDALSSPQQSPTPAAAYS